ncbi:MAG TPA: type II toxin-antitoxin system VapC family toxin [Acidobacteriaceae bacterium]
MIGIDTNVLLRYFAQDDPGQSSCAELFLDSLTPEAPGFVTLITVTELYWVLDHSFKLPRTEIGKIFEELLSSPSLQFEQRSVVVAALRGYTMGKADLDDYLIAACAQFAGCDYTVSFDQTAAKSGIMQLLT